MKIHGRGGLLKFFASGRRGRSENLALPAGGHFEIFAFASEGSHPLDVNSVTSLKGSSRIVIFLYGNSIQEGGWVARENFIADNFYNIEIFVTIYII